MNSKHLNPNNTINPKQADDRSLFAQTPETKVTLQECVESLAAQMGCDARTRPDGLWEFIAPGGESFTVDATIQGRPEYQNSSNAAHQAMHRLMERGKAAQAEARRFAAELFHSFAPPSNTATVTQFENKIDRAEVMSPGFSSRVSKIAQTIDKQERFAAACSLTLADLMTYYFVQHRDVDALLKLEGFSKELGEALENIAQRHGLDFSGVRAAATWLLAGTVEDELAAAKAKVAQGRRPSE
jgi:hypothetical protein